MTKRIFRSVLIAALSVFIASLVLIMGVLYRHFTAIQFEQLKAQTAFTAKGVDDEGEDYLKNLDTNGYRITLIDKDGSVIYDSSSDSGKMENHLERSEVKKAFSTGYGESKRYSSTLTKRLLYSAKLLKNGTVIRLSISGSTILILLLQMMQPIAAIFIFAVVLSIILATRLSKRVVKPLNKLDLDNPLENEDYDELSPLLRRIDSQQKSLKSQATKLRQKQDELNAVINNMNEGMVVISCDSMIIGINPAAAKILNSNEDSIGNDILTVCRNTEIQELILNAKSGSPAEKNLIISGRNYQINASPIISEKSLFGIVLLIFDITEKVKSELMRREFTANVSHELKTPLHSISGYAELIKDGMVKPNDIIPFSSKIYTEAQRMIQLVEDIINLSHLDENEGKDNTEKQSIDLHTVAETVIEQLKPKASESDVTLYLEGENAIIDGIPQLINEIVFNLCDNAIKYNRKGGSVTLQTQDTPEGAVLTVSDTGIGIPAEHQSRVFERFYRVDKSHSKEVGGTGLGLSIVKHAVITHGASIDLDSTVGKGTVIKVTFPK